MRNWYKHGSWNALCDVCGFKFKADQLKERWDGRRVCLEDLEFRHPSDLLRVPQDNPSVPWSRPEVPDVFIAADLLAEDGTTIIVAEDGSILEWI